MFGITTVQFKEKNHTQLTENTYCHLIKKSYLCYYNVNFDKTHFGNRKNCFNVF